MKQEDKEILLKDLCTRLPYGVYCFINDEPNIPRKLIRIEVDEVDSVLLDFLDNDPFLFPQCHLSEVKPYLRPMSSMTEEEIDEFTQFEIYADGEYIMPNYQTIDWLNKNMFDYRGLIPKGLAIEITEENNPYKED